jgi:hypothetical protein
MFVFFSLSAHRCKSLWRHVLQLLKRRQMLIPLQAEVTQQAW